MQVFDLSMPIEEGHFRWPIKKEKRGDFRKGDLFEVSQLATTCHGFTHMDAPRHMVPGGPTMTDLKLEKVVGVATVIDLEDIMPNEEITAARISEAATHLGDEEIVLFRTCWDDQRDWKTEAFWRDAPWLSAEACQWLLERRPTAIAFDFPQDWTIRLLLDGEVRPIEEHCSHHILLRNNVTLIEYLTGVRQVTTPKTFLCALPLNLPDADGAPARVIAMDLVNQST